MQIVKEFRDFALKGSVLDLAVGIVIGTAFGKIVSTLVSSIIMPPIGILINNMDFSSLRLILKSAGADGKGEVAIGYGLFLQDVINFLIIAWAMFFVIRTFRRLNLEHKPAPVAPSDEVLLLREIRDSLRVNKG